MGYGYTSTWRSWHVCLVTGPISTPLFKNQHENLNDHFCYSFFLYRFSYFLQTTQQACSTCATVDKVIGLGTARYGGASDLQIFLEWRRASQWNGARAISRR